MDYHNRRAKIKLLKELKFSNKEISEILNITLKMVYSGWHRVSGKGRITDKNYRKTEKCKIKEKRRNTKPHRKLRFLITSRIKSALKSQSISKSHSSYEYVGCTGKELYQYLEERFQPGMTWENQGSWHIDHIRPCASFDLSDIEQQKQCFHHSNLQPLWAADNLAKGAKWDNQSAA